MPQRQFVNYYRCPKMVKSGLMFGVAAAMTDVRSAESKTLSLTRDRKASTRGQKSAIDAHPGNSATRAASKMAPVKGRRYVLVARFYAK
jgi:hypothetical protein